MKIVDDNLGISQLVYCYFCSDCDERFYLETIIEPNDVSCPCCGESDVAISSSHLKELDIL